MGDRLVVNYSLGPGVTAAAVLSLLLQPLFENAVRHGAGRVVGSCQVNFSARREGKKLLLSLENDGPKRPATSASSQFGVGLTNTTARLRLYCGDGFGFEYLDRPQGGVKITISIPFKMAENREEHWAESHVVSHANSYSDS